MYEVCGSMIICIRIMVTVLFFSFFSRAPPVVPPQPATPALPKDFQDALDIIFPTDVKPDLMQQDLFSGLPGFPMGLGGVMPPFPPFLQPQMPPQMPPQMMMGFDLNGPLFQPRPQLYDTHVPLVPSPKPRNKNRTNNNQKDKHFNNKNQNQKNNQPNKQNNENKQGPKENRAAAARKKEELDDLAMLGIDASDVGAGI